MQAVVPAQDQQEPIWRVIDPDGVGEAGGHVTLSVWGLVGLVAAFVATFAVQRLLAPVSQRLGMLDHPLGRKDHACPTPTIGGIAILIGVLLTVMLLPASPPSGMAGFLLAASVLVVVGALDDKYDLAWYVRIPAQIIAALIMIYIGGVRIEHLGAVFGVGDISLGALSVPFTVFATIGIVNAVNMVDGIDGLAGMLVLAALLMLGAAAIYSGNSSVTLHALVLAGAVSAFLLYNMRLPWQRRAKIFMGNAGSAFLGLSLAWFAFRLTQNDAHPVTPVLALWLVPIPIMDCLALMLRRMRHGRSPFSADRNHIHHLMLEAGFGATGTVLILTVFSVICGLLAGQALLLHIPQPVLVIGFFGLCAAWYWLTSRRTRVLAFLQRVHRITVARWTPVPLPEPTSASLHAES